MEIGELMDCMQGLCRFNKYIHMHIRVYNYGDETLQINSLTTIGYLLDLFIKLFTVTCSNLGRQRRGGGPSQKL